MSSQTGSVVQPLTQVDHFEDDDHTTIFSGFCISRGCPVARVLSRDRSELLSQKGDNTSGTMMCVLSYWRCRLLKIIFLASPVYVLVRSFTVAPLANIPFLMSCFFTNQEFAQVGFDEVLERIYGRRERGLFLAESARRESGYIAPFCTRECADCPCSGTRSFFKGVKHRSPIKIKHTCVLSYELWYATECAEYDCGPNR